VKKGKPQDRHRTKLPDLPVAKTTCPDCWAVPGATHELSCPEVSPELAGAYIDAIHRPSGRD